MACCPLPTSKDSAVNILLYDALNTNEAYISNEQVKDNFGILKQPLLVADLSSFCISKLKVLRSFNFVFAWRSIFSVFGRRLIIREFSLSCSSYFWIS